MRRPVVSIGASQQRDRYAERRLWFREPGPHFWRHLRQSACLRFTRVVMDPPRGSFDLPWLGGIRVTSTRSNGDLGDAARSGKAPAHVNPCRVATRPLGMNRGKEWVCESQRNGRRHGPLYACTSAPRLDLLLQERSVLAQPVSRLLHLRRLGGNDVPEARCVILLQQVNSVRDKNVFMPSRLRQQSPPA